MLISMNPLKILRALFTSASRLTPAECMDRLRSGRALLVDVRERREWSQGVAKDAALLPLSDLAGARTRWVPFLAGVAGREILLYCAAGGRSGIAARILASEGFPAANTGGMDDWVAAGWPVIVPEIG
jgi:rhodanese-related sulfurtransferase